MKTYTGNVEITKDNAKEWEAKLKGVKYFKGKLSVSGTLTAPLLKECAELYVSGTLTAPLLKECTELSVYGTLTAPLLKECAELYVSGGATLTAPLLKECAELYMYGTLTAPLLKKERGGVSVEMLRARIVVKLQRKYESKGFLFCDNILSKIVSKRRAVKIVMWKTRAIGNSSKIIYVAQKGEVYSHGETPKQASHDLRYKITDRDTSKYKGWTLDSVHLIEDVIGAYRCITGACETGTKMFCEGKDIPAKMSVNAAIAATKGAWGADKFADFFTK